MAGPSNLGWALDPQPWTRFSPPDGAQQLRVLEHHLVGGDEGVKLVLPLAGGQARLPLKGAHDLAGWVGVVCVGEG